MFPNYIYIRNKKIMPTNLYQPSITIQVEPNTCRAYLVNKLLACL